MNSNENINISQICRTCFLENKDHKFLNDPEEKIDDRTLEEVFYDVVKVEMDENIKAVANRICLNCSNDLINAYNFIQMSLYNNERLTKILKRLDIKPTNIATDFKTDDSNHQNSIDSIKIEQESLQDYNSSMEYENSTENSSSSEAPNNKIKKQKLQCSACNKVFNYPHLYERHLTTHTEANRKAKNIGEQQSATCENNLTDQSNIEMGNQIKTSEERKRKTFMIVKHKDVMTAVPETWALLDPTQNEIIYWPRKKIKSNISDSVSLTDVYHRDELGEGEVIKRNFNTWKAANAEVNRLLNSEGGTFQSEYDQNHLSVQNQQSMNSSGIKSVFPNKINNISNTLTTPMPFFENIDQFNSLRNTNFSVESQILSNSYQEPIAIPPITNSEQTTFNMLKNLSNQVVSLQESMKFLLAGSSNEPGKCPHCFHCNPSLLNDAQLMDFQKIKTEEDLIKLENSLKDENYKQTFLKYCFGIIGFERKKDELGTCCLELSKEIFDKTFWSQTTWLGTIQSGGSKFSLCKHEIFINLFKFIVCKSTGVIPAKQFFAQFFQGRAKNCIQLLKSNNSRHPNQRKRSQTTESGCV